MSHVTPEEDLEFSAGLPPYPDRFYIAAQYAAVPDTVVIDTTTAHPAKKFSDLTNLLLYSLFQQASFGPCDTPKPWFLNVVESAKWSSWKELGDMSVEEAMRLFVRTLEEEDPYWWQAAKSTPGALALTSADVPYEFFDDDAELTEELKFVPDNQWEPITTSGKKPSPRYQHAAVQIGTRMFIVGGNSNGRYLNDVHMLDLCNLSWSKVEIANADQETAMPPLAGHVLIKKDRKSFLVIGGHSRGGTETELKVRSLDLQTRKWSIVSTNGQIPPSRGGHSATLIENKVWIFGGEDRSRSFLNDLYTLDLETWTWSKVAASGSPPSPRTEHSAAFYGGRYLTVFGGGSHAHCFNDLFVFDLESLTWSEPEVGGSIPGARAGQKGVIVGSNWYIVGGGDNKGAGNPDTIAMDMDSLTWSVVATSTPRTSIVSEGLSVVLAREDEPLLIAFGGYNGRYSNQLYAFRPGYTPEAKPKAVSESLPVEEQKESKAAEDVVPEASAEEAIDPTEQLARQLMEAEEAVARIEKSALDQRATAELVAAKARADAWLALGKAKMEEDGLKGQLNAALVEKEIAEKLYEEVNEELLTVKEVLHSTEVETEKLKEELAEAQRLVELKKEEEDEEVEKMRTDFMATKAVLAESEQELHSLRGVLSSEQARCFRLEVEVAELRQKLQGMEALERELDLVRRQKAAAEEIVAQALAKKATPPPASMFGWLSSAQK